MNNFFHFLSFYGWARYDDAGPFWCSCGKSFKYDDEIRYHIEEANKKNQNG